MRTFDRFFLKLTMALMAGCIDRVDLDVEEPPFTIVVEGWVHNHQGPYQVKVYRVGDIQSRYNLKEDISAKSVTISDNVGNSDLLTEVRPGNYESSSRFTGVQGRWYQVRVELHDGRIFESIPDTILAPGKIKKMHNQFVTGRDLNGKRYDAIEVSAVSVLPEIGKNKFLWKFIGTYQVTTSPERFTEPCAAGQCPSPLPCSGFVVTSQGLQQVLPCTCCTCWVNLYSKGVALGNQFVSLNTQLVETKLGKILLDEYILQRKLRIQVIQARLTNSTYRFFKLIKYQSEAPGSLFQPVSVRIKGNIRQIAGDEVNVEGLFYASANDTISTYIEGGDGRASANYRESCLTFPNSTNRRPDFWRD